MGSCPSRCSPGGGGWLLWGPVRSDAVAPRPRSEAVTEEELSRALLEGEEVTAPGTEGTGNSGSELSYALSAMDTSAETRQDTLSCGEEETR